MASRIAKARVVVDQEQPEVVHSADPFFPVGSLGLKLRETLPVEFGPTQKNFGYNCQLTALADAFARTVGLICNHLSHCGALILFNFGWHLGLPSGRLLRL
jgi:hypothetical protein